MSLNIGIDILLLYTQNDSAKWNAFLEECVRTQNINRLAQTMRELQVGMTALAAKKLNTDDIDVQFARWCRSLEKTAKQIVRIRNPLPQDNPLIAKTTEFKNQLEVKRQRDHEMELFFRKVSY